jgi:hypothetical protein
MRLAAAVAVALLLAPLSAQTGPNLLPDPSIEQIQPPNQFGIPFKLWGGWKFEGDCAFRVGEVARTGEHSAELVGGQGCKLRLYSPKVTVEPGRYRFACYLRGLDIGEHPWRLSEDFNFADDKYYQGHLKGTFGWTRMAIVKDVPQRQAVSCAIGLWAPGRLWVDDAELVKVGNDVPLTDGVVFDKEEAPIAPPGPLDPAQAVACPDCGYRNMPIWGRCYACGAKLAAAEAKPAGPDVKVLADFAAGAKAPFDNGTAVHDHAADGGWSLKVDHDWTSWDAPQDWTGYDYLTVDVDNPGDVPHAVYVEIRDKQTTDYWTRVNYWTTAPPGRSVVRMPLSIYVGEKSRPGRPLDRAAITRTVLNLTDVSANPLYFSRLRLERDTLWNKVTVPGLQAFHFGPGSNPEVRGFKSVTPATIYSAGRGYGFKNAHIWRPFDVLQPDPLYQAFICVESGGFAVDLPNGRYHVFCNIDSPSGYWGEVQTYRHRVVKANGVTVVDEKMDREAFIKHYYRFADSEDRLDENTFDKYQIPYFHEKEFDAEVTDGQLFVEFNGENWANCLSALVVYPTAQAEAGKAWLANLRERRRFWFDNYFKRVDPVGRRDADGMIPDLEPTAAEQAAGYAVFSRDPLREVPCNAVPRRSEVTHDLSCFANAGQAEPVVFSIYPLRDLGPVTVTAGDLSGPAGTLPAAALKIGLVSHRLSRVTMEGTVYTISPRFIMPKPTAEIRRGTTTTFWLTLQAPNPVAAGTYTGPLTLTLPDGKRDTLTLTARLFAAPLAEADVPLGPWGCNIALPWYGEDMGTYGRDMYRRCLATMRAAGLTSFSGIPHVRLIGFRNKLPMLDFKEADEQMADAKAAGFTQMICNYGQGIDGLNMYAQDEGAMRAAGFTEYVAFLKSVLGAIDAHAQAAGWLPVAWNLCDEPLGDDAKRSAANARAWRAAAPPTLFTTGATSLEAVKADDPHVDLVKALRIPNLNGHSEAAVKLLHDAGNDWGFYNDGNRWTFGTYFYKCVKEYGCRLRLSWHWNAAAGDPFYALDCREDDYAWYVTNARGEMIPTIPFERGIHAGVTDYRYLLTLERLLAAKPNHPAAAAGRQLLAGKMASFKLGQRDHDRLWPSGEYQQFRLKVAEAIEALSR